MLVKQQFMSRAGFSATISRDIVGIASNTTRNITKYLSIAGRSIDRYFLMTYLTSLAIPLGLVLTRPDVASSLHQEASAVWRQIMQLVDAVSRGSQPAYLIMRRFESVIEIVDSRAGLRKPSDIFRGGRRTPPSNSIVTGNGGSQEYQQSDRTGPRISNPTLNGSGSTGGTAVSSVRHGLSAFSLGEFLGQASNPDLWRGLTW